MRKTFFRIARKLDSINPLAQMAVEKPVERIYPDPGLAAESILSNPPRMRFFASEGTRDAFQKLIKDVQKAPSSVFEIKVELHPYLPYDFAMISDAKMQKLYFFRFHENTIRASFVMDVAFQASQTT